MRIKRPGICRLNCLDWDCPKLGVTVLAGSAIRVVAEGQSVTQDGVSAVRLTEEQEDEIARGLVARARSEGAELVGPDGLLCGLTKRVLQTAGGEELTDHLGYKPDDPAVITAATPARQPGQRC